MEITLKNKEFVDLFEGLTQVQKYKGVKFGMVVAKNIRTIQTELMHLEEASKPTKEFEELALKVKENPEKIKELEKKNKRVVEERLAQIEELQTIMEEESTLNLFEIKEELLPEEITGKEIMNIDKLIK